MKKPVYKLLDEKGRILIPKEFRQMAELESGDIVKLSMRVCMTGCRREVVSKRQRRSVSGKGGGLESINWDRTVQS